MSKGFPTFFTFIGLLSSMNSHIDRKSTRLNSSHLVISYAVFCLKKKHQFVCYDSQHTPPKLDKVPIRQIQAPSALTHQPLPPTLQHHMALRIPYIAPWIHSPGN